MNNPQKIRFFVLSDPRTGSSLLGSLLASHPDICWGSHELKAAYWDRQRSPFLRKISRIYPVPFLAYRARQTNQPVYGLKLMYHHLHSPRRIVPHLSWLGWRIISLERRDLFSRILSLFVSRQTGIWGHKKAQHATVGPLEIPVDAFLRQMETSHRAQQEHLRMLAGLPHLHLIYEDHLADAGQWQTTCRLAFKFFGLPEVLVHSDMEKTWHQPYSELVANYDELVMATQNSPLAPFAPCQG